MTQDNPLVSEIIAMAWCDKTSFEDIYAITHLREAEVKNIMRQHLKPKSYHIWRERVSGRHAKHKKKSLEKYHHFD